MSAASDPIAAHRPPSPLRLVAEDGRRLVRLKRAKGVEAQRATDAAQISRAWREIYGEAVRALAKAMDAQIAVEATFASASGGHSLTTRALARESCMEADSSVHHIKRVLALIEGGPCAVLAETWPRPDDPR